MQMVERGGEIVGQSLSEMSIGELENKLEHFKELYESDSKEEWNVQAGAIENELNRRRNMTIKDMFEELKKGLTISQLRDMEEILAEREVAAGGMDSVAQNRISNAQRSHKAIKTAINNKILEKLRQEKDRLEGLICGPDRKPGNENQLKQDQEHLEKVIEKIESRR
jgi:hypothetical protein